MADDADIDFIPFISIYPVTDSDTCNQILHVAGEKAMIIFSSVNAVHAVSGILNGKKPGWSVCCIGYATREAVKNYFGTEAIVKTARNARELADLINDPDTIYFFCGSLRRRELPGLLSLKGIEVKEICVYETKLTPVAIDRHYDAILFFSPSAVVSFFQKNKLPEGTILFAIGETTASEIVKYSGNEVIISDIPDKNQLIKKAVRLLKSAGTT